MGDRVLLVNRGLCNNLGDQAINIAFKSFLEDKFESTVYCSDYTSLSKSVDLINDNPNSKIRNVLKSILPLNAIWLFRNFYRIFKTIKEINPHLIVIGGGQLLLSNRFSIAAFTWVFIAKLLDVNIVFSNIGSCRSFGFFNKHLVKYALSKADGINLRDPRSKTFIENNFKLDKELYESADIVFTSLTELELNTSRDKTLLGIPCISVYNTYNEKVDRNEYYKIWLNFLDINKVDIKDCILIYTTKEDYIETLYFKEYFHSEFNILLPLEDCSTLNNYISVLKSSRTVISGRMHALILGLNYGTDNLVFPISDKLDEYRTICSKKEKLGYVRSKAINETLKFLSVFLKK